MPRLPFLALTGMSAMLDCGDSQGTLVRAPFMAVKEQLKNGLSGCLLLHLQWMRLVLHAPVVMQPLPHLQVPTNQSSCHEASFDCPSPAAHAIDRSTSLQGHSGQGVSLVVGKVKRSQPAEQQGSSKPCLALPPCVIKLNHTRNASSWSGCSSKECHFWVADFKLPFWILDGLSCGRLSLFSWSITRSVCV